MLRIPQGKQKKEIKMSSDRKKIIEEIKSKYPQKLFLIEIPGDDTLYIARECSWSEFAPFVQTDNPSPDILSSLVKAFLVYTENRRTGLWVQHLRPLAPRQDHHPGTEDSGSTWLLWKGRGKNSGKLKQDVARTSYYQMRAVICMKFSGYTFETVDSLPLSRVVEIYASAEWLGDEEKKAVEKIEKE